MAKKSFTNVNPALGFLSIPEREEREPDAPLILDGNIREQKAAALRQEAKSKRVQLLVKPSDHMMALEVADSLGISYNELANRAIAEFCKKRGK